MWINQGTCVFPATPPPPPPLPPLLWLREEDDEEEAEKSVFGLCKGSHCSNGESGESEAKGT